MPVSELATPNCLKVGECVCSVPSFAPTVDQPIHKAVTWCYTMEELFSDVLKETSTSEIIFQ